MNFSASERKVIKLLSLQFNSIEHFNSQKKRKFDQKGCNFRHYQIMMVIYKALLRVVLLG